MRVASQQQHQWKFYDFDEDWTRVIKLWNTTKIQNILKQEMHYWCRHVITTQNGAGRSWHIGEPLWNLSSKKQYWETKILDKIYEEVERYSMFQTFLKRTHDIRGKKFKDMELAYSAFVSTCFDALFEEFQPRPNTIESLILVGGKNFLTSSLHETASMLFPDDIIIWTSDTKNNNVLLIPEHHIVFDMVEFYFATRDRKNNTVNYSDAVYDGLVDEFFNGNRIDTGMIHSESSD